MSSRYYESSSMKTKYVYVSFNLASIHWTFPITFKLKAKQAGTFLIIAAKIKKLLNSNVFTSGMCRYFA